MVVDDEPMNIEMMRSMLIEMGYKGDSASQGYEALGLIKERNQLVNQGKASMYKLILLDFSMPDIDGPEVARQARAMFQEQTTSDTDLLSPIICCCTAYTEATFMRQAFLAGMNKFVTKPVSYKDLTECLQMVDK